MASFVKCLGGLGSWDVEIGEGENGRAKLKGKGLFRIKVNISELI